MDRTVPTTGSEELELYMRTYYSLLRSTQTIQIETLVESYLAMDSSLHVHARDPLKIDISALVYSSQRMPASVADAALILIGQVEKSFAESGYPVDEWERVYAPGRRRRTHFDGTATLAVFVVSRSDIDDLLPMLTAYQIEWNKLHALLQTEIARLFLSANERRVQRLTESELELLAGALHMQVSEVRRLETAWGINFMPTLAKIARQRKSFGVRLISGSQADYRRATAQWWDEIKDCLKTDIDLEDRPVYFVSSNTHSLVNLLTGFAVREEKALFEFIQHKQHADLLAEYQQLQETGSTAAKNNFLYYVLRKYMDTSDRGEARTQLKRDEAALGIYRIPSRHGFELETQIIEVNRLKPEWLDPRLTEGRQLDWLTQSDAVILNIDYPLGLGAYEILARLSERVERLLGVYVMGKAATLNARIGDVMISNVVHDEHSHNSYLFNNCFSAIDVAPFMSMGQVLDNQKAISALGTFLQNSQYMGVFYREGYTVLEMEAGPYLSAIYEVVRPRRHPQNEIVTLHHAPFDIGILHYASDTPFTKGHNLGAGSLSYAGVDPTYATAVAILHRLLAREALRTRVKVDARTLTQEIAAMNGLR
ncbi:MAG: hypothetical protein SF162_02155 [bacterium]|nr:hypothetical protein [bacterium]